MRKAQYLQIVLCVCGGGGLKYLTLVIIILILYFVLYLIICIHISQAATFITSKLQSMLDYLS